VVTASVQDDTHQVRLGVGEAGLRLPRQGGPRPLGLDHESDHIRPRGQRDALVGGNGWRGVHHDEVEPLAQLGPEGVHRLQVVQHRPP